MRQLIYRFQRTSCTPRNMVMLATPRYGSNHWGQGTGGGGGSAAAATLGMGLASMSAVTGSSSLLSVTSCESSVQATKAVLMYSVDLPIKSPMLSGISTK